MQALLTFILWKLRSQKWVWDAASAWLSTSSHTCSYLSGHVFFSLLPFFPSVQSWEFLLDLIWCEIYKAADIIQSPGQLCVKDTKWWEFSCGNQRFPSSPTLLWAFLMASCCKPGLGGLLQSPRGHGRSSALRQGPGGCCGALLEQGLGQGSLLTQFHDPVWLPSSSKMPRRAEVGQARWLLINFYVLWLGELAVVLQQSSKPPYLSSRKLFFFPVTL